MSFWFSLFFTLVMVFSGYALLLAFVEKKLREYHEEKEREFFI